MPSELRLRRRVQFYEADMAGIVHFSNFFRYMEEAEHALWREAGLKIATADEEIGYPRVHASCDFKSPLRFEDEFEVHVRVAAISRRSIRYDFTLTRGETLIATGSVTIVCVKKQTGEPMKATEIPADVASCFSVFAGSGSLRPIPRP